MEKISLISSITGQNNAFGVKIESNFSAYSKIENAMTFWQSDSSHYCLWGDNLTINGVGDKEFLDFLKPKTIFCNKETGKNLDLQFLEQGEVICKYIDLPKKTIDKTYLENSKQIFNLLISTGMSVDYEGFVLDLSLKLRNGKAVVSNIYKTEKLIATAICSYITVDFAIITAVAVSPSEQKQGYGKKVLSCLEEQLSGRKIFLFKEKGENDVFYSKCGYEKVDEWVTGKLVDKRG